MEKENSQEIHRLPLEYGNAPNKRLVNLYSRILQKKLRGVKPLINYGITTKVMNVLLKNYNEIQVASLVMVHFNYSGKNEWLAKTLKESIYKPLLLQSNAMVYISYLIFEKRIEFDDIDTLKDIVYNYIEGL